MTVYAYVAAGLFLLTLVLVGVYRLYETPGDYVLTPIPNPEGVEKYTSRTPAGDATVTMVLHPDLGQRFKIDTTFGGVPETRYVAPTPQVVERTLRAMAEDHLARRRALPQEPA